ncbi:MAG: NUDIX hydrolase, partial [Candidatus Omnitrophota bacterium]
FHTYSDPARDPRFHTISTVFICQAKGKPEAASDAAAARIFELGAWRDMEIAFDHKRVLEDYLRSR